MTLAQLAAIAAVGMCCPMGNVASQDVHPMREFAMFESHSNAGAAFTQGNPSQFLDGAYPQVTVPPMSLHAAAATPPALPAAPRAAMPAPQATPTASVSAAASGPLPAYVGPAGTYFHVPSTNTPVDALPPVYASAPAIINHPFDLWGGGAWSDDLRALVLRSSGHTSASFQSSLRAQFSPDYASITWIHANDPSKAWLESDLILSSGTMPDGSIGTPHSYHGMQIMPVADGGAPSLLQFSWAGMGVVPSSIAKLDLTKTSGGYGYFAGVDPKHPVYPTSVYPVSAYWKGHGMFVGSDGPSQYPDVLIRLDGTRENRNSLTTNYAFGAQLIDHVHQHRIGLSGGDTVYKQTFTLVIEELTGINAKRVHYVSITDGQLIGIPNGSGGLLFRVQRMGWAYSERYDRIIGYFEDATGGPMLVVLTPPAAGNRLADSWVCTVERPVRKPGDTIAPATLPTAVNSMWSKAAWVDAIDSYVIAPSSKVGLIGIRPSFAKRQAAGKAKSP